MSLQLSCSETCQIWMWFKESNRYLCKIENLAYRKINEQSFSNPHPWSSPMVAWPKFQATLLFFMTPTSHECHGISNHDILTVQQLVQANKRENIKAFYYCLFVIRIHHVCSGINVISEYLLIKIIILTHLGPVLHIIMHNEKHLSFP